MSRDANVVECLGSPEEIADIAVREFRRRQNLLSRSRLAAFLTFAVLPIPALCLAWITAFAFLLGIGECLECLTADLEPRDLPANYEVLLVHGFALAIWLLPAVGLAALFVRLARRTGRLRRWGTTACLLVALGTGASHYQLTFSDIPEKSQLIFGFGWHFPASDHALSGFGWPAGQLSSFLLPLLVGLLVMYRTVRRSEVAAV